MFGARDFTIFVFCLDPAARASSPRIFRFLARRLRADAGRRCVPERFSVIDSYSRVWAASQRCLGTMGNEAGLPVRSRCAKCGSRRCNVASISANSPPPPSSEPSPPIPSHSIHPLDEANAPLSPKLIHISSGCSASSRRIATALAGGSLAYMIPTHNTSRSKRLSYAHRSL